MDKNRVEALPEVAEQDANEICNARSKTSERQIISKSPENTKPTSTKQKVFTVTSVITKTTTDRSHQSEETSNNDPSSLLEYRKRKEVTTQREQGMGKNLQDIAEHEPRCKMLTQQPTADDGENQSPSFDHNDQECCQDVDAAAQLSVVGRQCRMSPRSPAKKMNAVKSGKINAFEDSKSSSAVPPNSIYQQPDQIGKSETAKPAMSNGQNQTSKCVYEENKDKYFQTSPLKDRAANFSVSSATGFHPQDTTGCCNEPFMPAPSNENVFPNDQASDAAQSIHSDKMGQTPAVECGASRQNTVDANERLAPKKEESLRDTAKDDQKAFFIDITTGESCTIESLSSDSSRFRGNRTLFLRQLLSQQKIDEAEHKTKTKSPRPARRRSASQGRVENVERGMDARLHKASKTKQHLPLLRSGERTEVPFVVPAQPSAHFDLRCYRNHDCAGEPHGSPQLRRRNATERQYYIEHWKGGNICRAQSSSIAPESSLQLEPQLDARGHHVSPADGWTSRCSSGHHQCVRSHADNHASAPCALQAHTGHSQVMSEDCVHSVSTITKHETPWCFWSSSCDPKEIFAQHHHHGSGPSDRSLGKSSRHVSASDAEVQDMSTFGQADGESQPGTDSLHTDTRHKPLTTDESRAEITGPHLYNDRLSKDPYADHPKEFVPLSDAQQLLSTEERPEDETSRQRMTLGPTTLLTMDETTSQIDKTGPVLQNTAVSNTSPPEGSGASNLLSQAQPRDQKRPGANEGKPRVSLLGRGQRVASRGLPSADAKNWTSVTLVSPQNMEMTFSLSTHLPDIGDRRGQSRPRQRASSNNSGLGDPATPSQHR
ncbi:uncharacterized protein LOC122391010 [Amphibalanus amphitrite]|uniref:uncharacterized protein LOC122391010 n=1 Tax=Amphibalanus amphitrite TaxID=1232801 RepID=UPI001C91BC86|nr:uncharacterized protein LOC122391010 [Amphibalanus amphitrite]